MSPEATCPSVASTVAILLKVVGARRSKMPAPCSSSTLLPLVPPSIWSPADRVPSVAVTSTAVLPAEIVSGPEVRARACPAAFTSPTRVRTIGVKAPE